MLPVGILIALIVIGLLIGWVTTMGVKSQWVRLLDVFVYGPILIYAGFIIEIWWLQIALILLGTTTITYNLRNFLILSV